MKLKILKDLYSTYYYQLVDTEILFEGLRGLSSDDLIEVKIRSLGPGIPPVREEIKVGDRLKQIEVDRKFLVARVGVLRKAMIEIVGTQEKFEELERLIELPK